MAVLEKSVASVVVADKGELLRIVEEQDRQTGFVPDPTATAHRAREMMLKDGVRPEDNIFSRGIIEMREE